MTDADGCCRRGEGRRRLRSLLLAACLLGPLFLVAPPGHAQLVLMPGELRENIAASGRVLQSTHPGTPGQAGSDARLTAVAFDRQDSLTQNIRLYAYAQSLGTATARGTLFVDFCVPRPGTGACDATSDPTAPDIVASITFGYGIVGVVNALGVGAKATLGASGSVIDLTRSAYVNFQQLADLSASLGTVKTVAKIPIPLPDFAGAEVTLPVTFTTLLKRGRVYRFQLAAAGTAAAGVGGSAESNTYGRSLQFPLQSGRVQLRNLSIQVAQDVASIEDQLKELREVTSSLLGQVGSLAEQIDMLRDNFDEDIAALNEAHADLDARIGVTESLLILPAGSPAPAGFTFVGAFDLAPSGGSRGRNAMLSVDVYRKNPP